MEYVARQSPKLAQSAAEKNDLILQYLAENPGGCKTDIIRDLNFDPHDRLKDLVMNGKIKSEMEGPKRKYYLV
jgi:hypothetical protein